MASISGQHRAMDVWHVPRSRGAISGLLLVLLGIWGGLAPFWGPQFGYAYTPGAAWTFTWPRFYLEILPAAASIIGGLGLLLARHRVTGILFGWLAAAGGAWFIVGPSLSLLFSSGPGTPVAHSVLGVSVTEVGLFYGLGAVVLFLAAFGLGRFSVGGAAQRRAVEPTTPATSAPETTSSPEE